MSEILDVLCPMNVVLDETGHVIHVGPTLEKLRPEETMVGKRFLEVFELNRPRRVDTMEQLLKAQGIKLHMRFRTGQQTTLKGVLVPSLEQGGAIINLSFGISILDGVRDYALTSADFAATDLTIEMLYLVEAKSAAMEASRKLNQRLQGAMIAAEEQAFTDTLTGLKNRRAVDHILPRLIDGTTDFAVMQMDLDFFKAVNDTMGHAAGDHVLQQVARILVEETRGEDVVARVGGDEFVLIFNQVNKHNVLADICQRIIKQIEKPMPFAGDECKISASIGIALSKETTPFTAPKLLANADTALYASKHKGRACYTFFEPENDSLPATPEEVAEPIEEVVQQPERRAARR
jgi:diguanylate cyclase (GGDEF)-like protein